MRPMKDTEIKKPEVELRSLINCSCVMDVIIEDYIHSQGLQNNVISLSKLLHIISFFLTVLILASI